MGREQSGRGGLSPAIVKRALELAKKDERLSARQISARLDIHPATVRSLKRALRLLAVDRPLPLTEVARKSRVGLKTVRLLARYTNPGPMPVTRAPDSSPPDAGSARLP